MDTDVTVYINGTTPWPQICTCRGPGPDRGTAGPGTARPPARRTRGSAADLQRGCSASSGERIVRTELATEAMGRVLSGLLPTEPEGFSLTALIELRASRFRTGSMRTAHPSNSSSRTVRRWDRTLIEHGLSMFDRAFDPAQPRWPRPSRCSRTDG